ncbi:MAG: DUF5916 domain-containing protein [Bacteroidota bacterium]
MNRTALLIFLCAIPFFVHAQSTERKSYTTKWVEGEPPAIDGFGTDKAWQQVEWSGDFTQRFPNEGEKPSQQTSFKILYDAKNLYVLIRAFDTEPEKIVKRMSRRDGFEGDWVEVNIDSYNDKRTAFSFTASVTGVKGDEYISNGDNWDSNWDPIWYLRTSVDDQGWIAEYRIPLSQLRFAEKPEHTWGIQVNRRFFRNEEMSNWQFIEQNAPGWVHLFGELRGIKGIKPQKQKEIQPYIVAQTERFEKEEGNPFATGRSSDVTFGVDGKLGITSDITLDFTINPDFGQVEADPSQVNLSAFQVFFSEQRPFFIEGNNILDFRLTNSEAGGPFNRDNLFYSRRIGGSPHRFPSLDDNEYADQPSNTRILGAAKLTGKNQNGFSWGVLESLTAEESAEVDNSGERREEVVEPMTNYLVGRVQQDINGGDSFIGGMITATNRFIDDPSLEFIHRSAYSGGIDVTHRWKDRTYAITFNTFFSNVNGTPEAITQTQEAPERFFQRPDNFRKRVDTTRTALTGTGGTLTFGKNSGKLVFQTGATYRSPELELNDIGFLRSTDQINQWTWVGYRIQKAFAIFRNYRVNFNQYLNYDFGGVNTYRAVNFNTHMQFKNFWSFSTGFTTEGRSISNSDLRGGPSIIYPGGVNHWYWFGTDNRKKFRMSFNQWNWWGQEDYARNGGYSLNLRWQPTDAFNISLSPSYTFNRNDQQYVSTEEFGAQARYITARIDQDTYRMTMRFTYLINPNLSIQYYGQPFVSRGDYSDFNRITNAGASEYTDRFQRLEGSAISFNEEGDEYLVDETGNGTTNYTISNPDFNFVQFRSNAVLRWEYIPGSTFFLVWTQDRTASLDLDGDSSFGGITSDLLDVTPHNIFLMKFTYRFVL